MGLHFGRLLSWHRKEKIHPLFDPDFAKENLVSLAETFVVLFLYLVNGILALHLAVTLGLFETETLLWLIIELNARTLYFGLPEAYFQSVYVAAGILAFTIVSTALIHLSLDVLRASLHLQHAEKIPVLDRLPRTVRLRQPVLVTYFKNKLAEYLRRVAYYKAQEQAERLASSRI